MHNRACRLAAFLLVATSLTPAAGMAQTLSSWRLTGDYLTNSTQTFLTVGNTATGIGSATGSGAGGTVYSLPDGLFFGSQASGNGTGTLTDINLSVGGGTSQYIFVGDQGRGALTLSGVSLQLIGTTQDSTEPSSPFIAIGRQAGSNGVLSLQPGTQVSIYETPGRTTPSSASTGAGVQIGGTRGQAGGSGRLTVDGDSTALNIGAVTEAYLNVGRNGSSASGSLAVTSGGRIQVGFSDTVSAFIGIGRGGAQGTADVSGRASSGTFSLLNMNGTTSLLDVGRDSGSVGTLTVRDGGAVGVVATGDAAGKSSTVRIGVQGGSGSVTVDGSGSYLSLATSGQASSAAAMSVGRDAGGSGTLTLSNGGRAFVGGSTSTVRIGEAASSQGTVTISGTSSQLISSATAAGTMNGIAVGHAGSGSLTVRDGGSVYANTSQGAYGSIVVGATPTGSGTLTASGSNTVVYANNFFGVGARITGGTPDAPTIADGGAGSASFSNFASLTASTVQLSTPNPGVLSDRLLSFTSGARINAGEAIVYPGGVLSGNGAISGQVVLRGGRLSTGSSVGTMSIGNGLQMTSGTLEVKVNGTSAGQYDVYAVTGAAAFSGGTVLVVFADSFQPAGGDRFTVVTTTAGATGNETVATQTNRNGVNVQFVPASQSGALDILVVGGTTVSTSNTEELESVASATAQEQTRSVVRSVVTSVSARIREVASARRSRGAITAQLASGLSAGDGTHTSTGVISAWVDGGVSRLLNDTVGSKFDGYSRNLIVGADRGFGDFVVGGAVTLERSTLTLSDTDGDRSSNGLSFLGYVGYLIDEVFSADVQVGAGRLSNRLRETRSGVTESGDYASNRLIAATNLNATWGVGDVTLVGTVGASFSRERFDSYSTDTGARVSPDTVYLGQVRFGTEVSYALGSVSPYVSAAYEVDVRSSEGGDRNGAVLGAGLRAPLDDNLSVGVFGSAQLLRENDRNYTMSANLRYTF